jgi:hypothetical protein
MRSGLKQLIRRFIEDAGKGRDKRLYYMSIVPTSARPRGLCKACQEALTVRSQNKTMQRLPWSLYVHLHEERPTCLCSNTYRGILNLYPLAPEPKRNYAPVRRHTWRTGERGLPRRRSVRRKLGSESVKTQFSKIYFS